MGDISKGQAGEKRPLLERVVVLDLRWATAGPFGTMMLADLSAELIKIERFWG